MNKYAKTFISTAIALLALSGCGTPADVNLSIDTSMTGDRIPEDFIGLSVETGSLRVGNGGFKQYSGHFFSDDNPQTIQIFETLGIKHLRVGGGSVDMNQVEPTLKDIDHLFAFAKKAGVKVVYSFKLLNGDLTHNIELAKYIWDNYSDLLDCFSVGNEPDWNSYHKEDPEIVDYPTYRDKWLRFAKALKDAVPEATFAGPNTGSNYPVTGAKDTGYNGKTWTVNFADDLKDEGLLSAIYTHNYVGQDVVGLKLTPQEMVDRILSPSWPEKEFLALYEGICEPVLADGFPYRLAESNSFSSGCDGGSNSFVTALFSLDYMHWWAEHKCAGVNFHNKQWVVNAPIGMDKKSGNLIVNPVGYGYAAFKMSSDGYVQPMKMRKNSDINMTAYAVRNDEAIYVTLINKEYGETARPVSVSINVNKNTTSVETLVLSAPDGSPLSLSATLGGEAINSFEPWAGRWNEVSGTDLNFTVNPTSAMIVKIAIK
ncbi:MAG: hypothetical protein ACI3ZN_11210 [Candidatus Cryptobacteroides sp.]